ncbi:MAG: hypothetical protein U9P42_09705 [Candidatus Fermentibacteria bacterium]|nr:hypothetical protein [Candidatus Fermentibacteria bacterium]
MELFNILAMAVNTQPDPEPSATSALLFSFYALAVFLLIQFLGARFFTRCKERFNSFVLISFIVLASLAAGSLTVAFFLGEHTHRLFLGVISGVFIWTALGEIAEQLEWYRSHARNAVWIYLLTTAAWLAMVFLIPGIPVPILGFIGYPLLAWGTHLTRVRFIHKWGAASFASTLLLLFMAAISGGAIVAGALIGTRFAGMMAGLVFAVSTWSIMEIIWERGMANGPWKYGEN